MADLVEMIGYLVEIVTSMYILESITVVQKNKKNLIIKIVCIFFMICFRELAERKDGWWNLTAIIYETVGYCIYLVISARQKFTAMLSKIMAVSIVNAFAGILVAFLFSVLFPSISQNETMYIYILITGFVLRLFCLLCVCYMCKKYHIDKIFEQKRASIIIIILGVLFQLSKISTRLIHPDFKNVQISITVTIMCMGFIMVTLWGIDWYCNEKEKKRLWEDIQVMAQKLHKQKEIMPVLNATLNQMQEKNNIAELQNIKEEIEQLCNEQIKEQDIEDSKLIWFPKTDYVLLDKQLQLYGKEALEKSTDFKVFAGTSIGEALKNNQIQKLQFLRLVGDLMRNAFRAIEKKESNGGNILLAMGYVENIFQIDVYDDGVPFSSDVLEQFGKRGNTEGGTGNGMSDCLEFLEKCKATFKLTEFEKDFNYTKCITIIWDSKNERLIETNRFTDISQISILTKVKKDADYR